jgi:hypothetical protein
MWSFGVSDALIPVNACGECDHAIANAKRPGFAHELRFVRAREQGQLKAVCVHWMAECGNQRVLF